jgi:hypothetical protein
MWDSNKYGNSGGGSKASEGYVEEGNIRKFLFSDKPTRVRFMTEDVTVEDVMAELKVTREEAEDVLFTKVMKERWVMPTSFWEHQIKEIPGKRYFSTAVCQGRSRCQMCVDNDADRANGINENKMLTYPVRKRFMAPAFVYDLNMVLFVIGNEEFFNDVATYINRNGSKSDFELWKTGRGLTTKYKVAYVGLADDRKVDSSYPSPQDVDMSLEPSELNRRITGAKPSGAAKQPALEQPAQQPEQHKDAAGSKSAGDFLITFGSYKGRTLKEILVTEGPEYVQFLAKNSAGVVKETAAAFLAEVGL